MRQKFSVCEFSKTKEDRDACACGAQKKTHYTKNNSIIQKNLYLDFSNEIIFVARKNALKRCFNNIIENGLNYATNVHISMIKTASRVNIFIDDDGPGIPINQYKNVFKPFYRLDDSRNLNNSGVGLGMSIAEDIVRSHGGNIELNESKKKGLQVKISLPL